MGRRPIAADQGQITPEFAVQGLEAGRGHDTGQGRLRPVQITVGDQQSPQAQPEPLPVLASKPLPVASENAPAAGSYISSRF